MQSCVECNLLLFVEPQSNPLAGTPSSSTKDRLNPFNTSFHPEQTIQSFPTSSIHLQQTNYPPPSPHLQQSNYPPPSPHMQQSNYPQTSSSIYCNPPVVVPHEEVISPEQAFVRVSQGK